MSFTGKATCGAGVPLPEGAEDLSDLVAIVSPFETPLLDALGDAADEAQGPRHEWLAEDEADGDTVTLAAPNWVQTFRKSIAVSRADLAMRHLAVADELDFQKAKALRELLRDLENCVINGMAISAGFTSKMGGIIERTANRFPARGEALTATMLDEAIAKVCNYGYGQPDLLVTNGLQKRRIDGFGSSRHDDMGGLRGTTAYEGDHGVQRVVLSRWVPRDTVLVLDSTRLSVLPQAGRSFRYLKGNGGGEISTGKVTGDYTLELRNEAAHGLIHGLKETSDAT